MVEEEVCDHGGRRGMSSWWKKRSVIMVEEEVCDHGGRRGL